MNDEEIVRHYANMVYKIAFNYTRNKIDADDIFSETFLKLFRKKRKFESDEHQKAYLIRVTINCAKTFLSKRKSELPLDEAYSEIMELNYHHNDVLASVVNLPEQQRTVIHLFYYEDYSIPQISKMLQMNENTVKTHLRRAKEKLKPMLKELVT